MISVAVACHGVESRECLDVLLLLPRVVKKRIPRGGNNNLILPAEYERLSGSTARHGGVTRVKVVQA